MRASSFYIFFSIILVLYALINYYIFRRGLQALPKESIIRSIYVCSFIALASAYLIGRILSRYFHNTFIENIILIGSFWLAAMIYFLIIVLFMDLLRLVNHFLPIFPEILKNNYQSIKKYSFFSSIIIVLIILAYGYINALNPRLKTVDIKINKKVDGINNFKIVMIADVHLGTIIGRERFKRIVDKINAQNPDLVLIVGDLVDESIGPVVNDNIGGCIERLNSRYGVYAVTGNHEFIGGAESAVNYFSKHGLKFLRDSLVVVDNKIVLVGREDRIKARFTGTERISLNKILKNVDSNKPVILMDHQPFELSEAEKNGIDLQLSGHTHHGQIFPFNFIAKKIYEVSWGYKKNGDTHIYVSSGVGTWGPPIRIGNHPEIVKINLSLD